jgi:hypothetical protein
MIDSVKNGIVQDDKLSQLVQFVMSNINVRAGGVGDRAGAVIRILQTPYGSGRQNTAW